MGPAEKFLNYIRFEKRYSDHTLISYQSDIQQFSLYLATQFETKDLREATFMMIRSWVVSLMDVEDKVTTVNRKISTLKSMYKYLMKMGEIKVNPTAKLIRPKTPKRLPGFVEEGAMEKLFDTFQYNQEDAIAYRDTLILELLYTAGLRRSELMNIQYKDVDVYQMQLKVLGKRRKERIIPLHREMLQHIEQMKTLNERYDTEDAKQYLFLTDKGLKIYPELIYLITKKHLSHVTTIQKKSPHVLRHSFATHLLNHGAEINAIKELLGHGSLASTQVYTHNTIDKLKNIYKQAHPRA